MTVLAGDHSTGGAIIGGTLARAGLGAGIVRYACANRGNVNITPAEVRDLRANGIPLAIVLEHEADWLVRPGVGPRVTGSLAITRACNVPDGLIWLACDFDATHWGPTVAGSPGDKTMHAVAAGIDAARAAWPHVGFYGSYFAIEWLIAHGYGWLRFWQTGAWSWGKRHPAACLYQRAQSFDVAGVQVDVDEVWQPDFGQRVQHEPPPPPPPPPQPQPSGRRARGTFEIAATYHHDARELVAQVTGGTYDLGDVSEIIRLELDLQVGQHNPRAKQITGLILGTRPPS